MNVTSNKGDNNIKFNEYYLEYYLTIANIISFVQRSTSNCYIIHIPFHWFISIFGEINCLNVVSMIAVCICK